MLRPQRLRLALALGLCAFAGTVGAQVSLTATGGTPTATYNNVRLAFVAINAGTHTGDVVLNITADISDNTVAVLNAANAGAAYTSVTIRPSGGATRTLTGAIGGNALLRFNGAANITIDGLNTGSNALVMQNTSQSLNAGTSVIRFEGGSVGSTITNCMLRCAFQGPLGTFGGTLLYATGNNDNHVVSNCEFGPVGVNLPTKHIQSQGSTDTVDNANSNIRIQNNLFYDCFRSTESSAMIFAGIGTKDWIIDGNRFFQTGARSFASATILTHYVIRVSSPDAAGYTITNNVIGFASRTETGIYAMNGVIGKFVAIEFAGDPNGALSTIANNRISAISLTGDNASGAGIASPFTGIRLDPGNVDVTSNTIGSPDVAGSLTFSTTNTNGLAMYGIFSNGATQEFRATSNTIAGLALTVPNTNTTTNLVAGMRMTTATAGVVFRATSNVIGTAAAPLANLSTSTGGQAWGLASDTAAVFTGNTIQNLSASGTGTTTSASTVGLGVDSAANNHSLVGNTIFNLSNPSTTGTTAVTGILFRGGSGANRLGRNIVHSLSLSSTNNSARLSGIAIVNGSGTHTVDRNFIHSFAAMPAGGVMAGIVINGGTGLYANNMIRLGLTPAGTSNTAGVGVRGIWQGTGTTGDRFYHNSVYLGGTGVTDSANTAAFLSDEASAPRTLQNNLFVNARSNGTGTGLHFAIRLEAVAGLTSDYNLFRVSGTGGTFGQINAVNHANLAAWRTATGGDAHSLEGDPRFRQPDGTLATVDLHLSNTLATPAESAGLAVAEVTDDFDGESRAAFTPTDLGADAGVFIAPGTGNPIAGTLSVSSSQGFTLAVAKTAILAVCSDPNSLPLTVIAVGAVSNQGGLVTLGANSASYSPPTPQFTGADVFSYTVQNSSGMTASGVVNVSVQAPPFPPRATSVVLGSGSATFTVTHSGVPGLTYALEYTDSLTVAFQPVLDLGAQPVVATADAVGNFTFNVAQSPAPPKRFYRVRAQ